MKYEKSKMKKEIRVDTPPNPLGTLEVVSVSESVSDSVRSKFYWGPRPRRPFWGRSVGHLGFSRRYGVAGSTHAASCDRVVLVL